MQKLPLNLYPEKMRKISQDESKASNFSVAKEFACFMASTLGPQSAQKVIVGSDFQQYILTSDGKTILQRFDLAEFKATHPVAQLMVELAKSTDDEVGDGTTSSVILAGALLTKAERLIDMGLHPNIVSEGYKKATTKAIEIMEALAIPVKNDDMLKKVARTSIDTKYMVPGSGKQKQKESKSLADTVLSAVHKVSESKNGVITADPDNVHVVKKGGADIFDTMLFSGFIVEKEALHPSMPKYLENVKVAVLDVPLTVKRYDGLFGDLSSCSVKMDSVEQYKSQKGDERSVLYDTVGKIADLGVGLIISRKLMDEKIGKPLSDRGIIAIPAIPTKEDLNRLSKACGARIVSDIGQMTSDDLGFADSVRQKRYPDRTVHIFVETKKANSATILLRGGIAHALSDIARAVHDALHTTANAYNNEILPGGGATEMYISAQLKRYALSIKTKKQLAVTAFAEALEVIPQTLAKNCGADPISVITDLRKDHAAGNKYMGFDTIRRKIVNMVDNGIVESLITKKQIFKGADETSRIIMLSDDIIYGNVFQDRIEEKTHGQ